MSNTDAAAIIERRGMMLVMSSPSGAGKTTLSRQLLASDDNIELSVSVTTRTPRPGEVDGRDYRFVSQSQFETLRDSGDLLEWAEVFDNLYGTPKAPVEAILSGGRDVLFDIDWQGTQQLSERMKNDLVRIFILPPSAEELAARLSRRAQDTADIVAGRMAKAASEISHWPEYDYVLVNEDIERCGAEITAILKAERLRRSRRTGLSAFVRQLQDTL